MAIEMTSNVDLESQIKMTLHNIFSMFANTTEHEEKTLLRVLRKRRLAAKIVDADPNVIELVNLFEDWLQDNAKRRIMDNPSFVPF